MPHTRLDRITYTVHADTEADLIHEARARLRAVVIDVEQWTLAIDAESRDQTVPHLEGAVTATRPPTASIEGDAVTVHDDLAAIPDRVTQLERHVAALELAYLELTKQNAANRRGAVTRQTYTITEAASLFGCTRTQVYEMIAANRLHAFTVGTHARRIPADEVRRLLTQDAERQPI